MSVEPPLIDLGKYKPPVESLPNGLAARAAALGIEVEGRVLSTRNLARIVIADNERHRDAYSVILRCDQVAIATPSFFDELLKVWPRITLAGPNEDVLSTFHVAASNRARSPVDERKP